MKVKTELQPAVAFLPSNDVAASGAAQSWPEALAYSIRMCNCGVCTAVVEWEVHRRDPFRLMLCEHRYASAATAAGADV